MKKYKVLKFICILFLLVGCSNSNSKKNVNSSNYSSISSKKYINEQKVHYVETLIEELPNPSTNNLVVQQIFTAKEFYDALDEIDQANVYNFTKLENYVSQIYDYVKPELSYTSKYDVALYIFLYDGLPNNYISKTEATKNGWNGSGSSLWQTNPQKSIGGDPFYNLEGLLPKNAIYFECDIDYNGKSRGAKRIVYSLSKDTIYYTQDHYETFEQLY